VAALGFVVPEGRFLSPLIASRIFIIIIIIVIVVIVKYLKRNNYKLSQGLIEGQ